MRVGFGKLASMSFKDLYEAVDRDRKGFTKWVRKQESRPGTKMDALQYMCCRSKHKLRESKTAIYSQDPQRRSLSRVTRPPPQNTQNFARLRGRAFNTRQRAPLCVPPGRPILSQLVETGFF
ncbi:unnamed protein product [Leuciscus chuanchicus]